MFEQTEDWKRTGVEWLRLDIETLSALVSDVCAGGSGTSHRSVHWC